MKISNSASKIVFITITYALCLAFLYEVFVGRVTLEANDFLVLAGMAFAFYFSNKGDASSNVPYLGK